MDSTTSCGCLQHTVEAVVTRCGCGNPESHPDSLCPTPRAIEDLGVIAYWHRSFWKRLAFNIRKHWR